MLVVSDYCWYKHILYVVLSRSVFRIWGVVCLPSCEFRGELSEKVVGVGTAAGLCG